MPPKRLHAWLVDLLLVGGVLCLLAAALLATTARNVVDSSAFATRTAQSLSDPRVARFVADQVVQGVIDASPDLLTVKPLLLVTTEGLVASKAFAAVVRRAAFEAHRRLFSESGRNLMLSAPDVGILLRQALEQTSPQLAAKVPERLDSLIASATGNRAELVVALWRLGHRLRGFARIGAGLGFALLALGIAFARDRMRAVARVGGLLIIGSVLLASVLPLGRLAIASLVQEPLARGALQGLWRTYLGELLGWGLFLGGLGVLCTAAATSLLNALRPQDYLRVGARTLVTPPARRLARAGWGVGLLALGVAAVALPHELLAAVMVLMGVLLALMGVRELFRLALDSVEPVAAEGAQPARGRLWLRPAIVASLVLALAVGWLLLRGPSTAPVAAATDACNGHPELCGRRVDQVAFAAAHNAMSNASIPDWMFPHHQAGIPKMLEDGVRTLMIDVHYGFPGGERIKTDIEGEDMTRDKLVGALGEEGVAAAERIRDRLVGVDEGKRGLYLCHGFCELGATTFEPTLRDIQTFLVQHPNEVLLVIIEDYVTPQELAEVFAETGLAELVYEGPSEPWPTLGELIDSGRRVIVFLESGKPGVPWLRPVIGNIQETPYSYRTPEEFSCKPNRGGRTGSLFLVNHWIETTPTPKPSNAEIVNARAVLLPRLRTCAKARGHIPNIVAVDFYQSGDLMAVVDELNGVSATARDAGAAPAR